MYRLAVIEGEVESDEFTAAFEEQTGYYLETSVDREKTWFTDGKWYDHVTHMVTLSREFPGLTFRLEGHGESLGDAWVLYVRDGRVSDKEKWDPPPFDERKLR